MFLLFIGGASRRRDDTGKFRHSALTSGIFCDGMDGSNGIYVMMEELERQERKAKGDLTREQ